MYRNSPLHIARYMYICVGPGRAPAGGGLGVSGLSMQHVQLFPTPHALSIPTTAAAADPSRAGQARLTGILAAYRRVRPGLPTADPPGGRCNQCRSRCSERNLNAMPAV